MDSEWLSALAPRLGFDPKGPFDADQFAALSPLEAPDTSELVRRQELQRVAERNNLWLRDYTDPAVMGLALQAAQEGISGEQLYQFLTQGIFRAVMLHEIGHTVGFRHNFGGSADSL